MMSRDSEPNRRAAQPYSWKRCNKQHNSWGVLKPASVTAWPPIDPNDKSAVEQREEDAAELLRAWWSEEPKKHPQAAAGSASSSVSSLAQQLLRVSSGFASSPANAVAVTGSGGSTLTQIPIPYDSVRFERLPDDHEPRDEFFQKTLMYIICSLLDVVFLLFWGWEDTQHRAIRVFGGVFPRYIWGRASACHDRLGATPLHKQFAAEPAYLRAAPYVPLLPIVVRDDQQAPEAAPDLQNPNLSWLKGLISDEDAFENTAMRMFYMPFDPTMEQNASGGSSSTAAPLAHRHKPYDGSRRIVFRPDEAQHHVFALRKLFYCMAVIDAVDSSEMTRDNEKFARAEAYMLEADLSDPKARELDYKTRVIWLLLAARLKFQARSKRKAASSLALAASVETGGTSSSSSSVPLADAALMDDVASLMIQTVAFQFETRHRYIFRSERKTLRMASLTGAYVYVCENVCSDRRDVISPLWDERDWTLDVPKLRSRTQLGDDAMICTHRQMRELIASQPVVYNVFSVLDDNGTPNDVKIEKFADHRQMAELWRANYTRELDTRVRYDVDQKTHIAYVQRYGGVNASTSHPKHHERLVLLPGVPVVFFMLWDYQNHAWALDVLAELLDVVVRDTRYHKRASVLYFGHERGTLTGRHFRVQMWNGDRHQFVALPSLVFSDVEALQTFVERVVKRVLAAAASADWLTRATVTADAAQKLADGIETTANGVYKPGHVFAYLAASTCELHPPLSSFLQDLYKHKQSRIATSAARSASSLGSDVYLMPYNIRTKEQWDRYITAQFLQEYASPERAAIPECLLVVPACDLDHTDLIAMPPAQVDAKKTSSVRCNTRCVFDKHSVGLHCSACDSDSTVLMGTPEKPSELYKFVHYRHVPMWLAGLALQPVREMCLALDAKYGGSATPQDLDAFLSDDVGLESLWKSFVELTELNLRALGNARVDLCVDYDALCRDITDSLQAIQGDGGSGSGTARLPRYPDELKNRIKEYIALRPEAFGTYVNHNEAPTTRTPKYVGFRSKGALQLSTTKRTYVDKQGVTRESLPGHFVDWKFSRSGDAFAFIMHVRWQSSDTRKYFVPAVMFAHRWVLQTYGLDALEHDPADRPDLAQAAASLRASSSHATAASNERRLREARARWASAYPFSPDPRDGSEDGVNYMRNTRKIQSARVLFESRAFRYHPACPVYEDNKDRTYGAVLVPLYNPMDTARELRGIQSIFIDEAVQRKSEFIRQQKRTRGEMSGNGALLQDIAKSARQAAIQEFRAWIAIGEGPETMASVAEACPELQVWAMLGIKNIDKFPYLTHEVAPGDPDPLSIIYCADNDNTKPKLLQEVQNNVDSLTGRGYRVLLCKPDLVDPNTDTKADFNDLLVRLPYAEAIQRIRATLKTAQVFMPRPRPPTPPAPAPIRIRASSSSLGSTATAPPPAETQSNSSLDMGALKITDLVGAADFFDESLNTAERPSAAAPAPERKKAKADRAHLEKLVEKKKDKEKEKEKKKDKKKDKKKEKKHKKHHKKKSHDDNDSDDNNTSAAPSGDEKEPQSVESAPSGGEEEGAKTAEPLQNSSTTTADGLKRLKKKSVTLEGGAADAPDDLMLLDENTTAVKAGN